MNEDNRIKPNFNDPQYNQEYKSSKKQYENAYGEPSYMPNKYDYTNSFYDEEEKSGAGSFLVGALVGGVIGAAAALFLAPKTGQEMRENLSSQASQLKDKSIEIGAVAKDKTTELTSVAKLKTGELTKSIQEQSEQLVDKVKSMTSKTSVPMDDGTASSEGEEAIEFVANKAVDTAEEITTSTAEALKEAVVNFSDKNNTSNSNQSTGNSNVAYDNSENFGKDKVTNQNYVSEVTDKE